MQLAHAMGATSNKIKGKLKELEGKVTGDPVRRAEGKVQSTAGKVAATVKAGARRVKAKAKIAKAAVSTKVGRKAIAARITP
ncbi:MAG: CsbD family protein [Kofleriaceae bacterium]